MKHFRLLGSRLCFILVAAIMALPGSAQTGAKKAPKPAKLEWAPAWVELGENGAIIARQVLFYEKTPPPCQSILIDGKTSLPMTSRGAAPQELGLVIVCEAVIPGGTRTASINGVKLPVPHGAISKIVLLGDTGCKGDATGAGKRVEPIEEADEQEEAEEAAAANASDAKPKGKKSKEKQDCKSDWPFATVSKHAAGENPDLVIHVGDYVYIKGDTWENWNWQFFQPARDLLQAAPWVFVRGNHEICSDKLHGAGFFYLLDPRPPISCDNNPNNNSTAPYLVKAGNSLFMVMDSSGAECDFSPSEPGGAGGKGCSQSDYASEVKTWTGLFSQGKQLLGSGNAFLLTHRPLWGIKSPDGKDSSATCPAAKKKTLVAINSTMQAGYLNSGMTGIKMVLSGHIHNFQLITYSAQNPGVSPQPQLVVGDSGVELSTPPPSEFKTCKLTAQNGVLNLSTFQGMKEFGFGVLTSDAAKFDLYLKKGERALRCDIGGDQATCKVQLLPIKPAKGATAASGGK